MGAIYLAALAAVLLLGLVIPSEWLTQAQLLAPRQVEATHRVSLALLIFYAGLKTDQPQAQPHGDHQALHGLLLFRPETSPLRTANASPGQ